MCLHTAPAAVLQCTRRRLVLGTAASIAVTLLSGATVLASDTVAVRRHALMARAAAMRDAALRAGDQGYGAVVARAGEIIAESPSRVIAHEDPTAHAEMEAIRLAARRLGTRDLSGCELYGSSRACPMCESAAYWARITRMFYGSDAIDAGPPRLRGG